MPRCEKAFVGNRVHFASCFVLQSPRKCKSQLKSTVPYFKGTCKNIVQNADETAASMCEFAAYRLRSDACHAYSNRAFPSIPLI